MHIIIPLADFNMHKYVELRYCLRSIEKYLTWYDDIYIVTKRLPKWITNVKHIAVSDLQRYGCAQLNIDNKINWALSAITADNVLLMHDDIYFTETINVNRVPYYHKGSICDNIQSRNKNESYTKTLFNTYQFLMKQNKTTYDFDPHYPIILNKQKFYSTVQPVVWPVHGYNIRSLYCNMHHITGEYLQDNKIKKASEFKEGMKFFSTTDSFIDADMKALFERLYPLPSRYEK